MFKEFQFLDDNEVVHKNGMMRSDAICTLEATKVGEIKKKALTFVISNATGCCFSV